MSDLQDEAVEIIALTVEASERMAALSDEYSNEEIEDEFYQTLGEMINGCDDPNKGIHLCATMSNIGAQIGSEEMQETGRKKLEEAMNE